MECSALTSVFPLSIFCINALNSGVSSSSLETTSWTSLSQARADWSASTVSTVMGCWPAREKEAGDGGDTITEEDGAGSGEVCLSIMREMLGKLRVGSVGGLVSVESVVEVEVVLEEVTVLVTRVEADDSEGEETGAGS